MLLIGFCPGRLEKSGEAIPIVDNGRIVEWIFNLDLFQEPRAAAIVAGWAGSDQIGRVVGAATAVRNEMVDRRGQYAYSKMPRFIRVPLPSSFGKGTGKDLVD